MLDLRQKDTSACIKYHAKVWYIRGGDYSGFVNLLYFQEFYKEGTLLRFPAIRKVYMFVWKLPLLVGFLCWCKTEHYFQ
jgi:hypothetical protein